MSNELEKARLLYEKGQYRKAADELRYVESLSRTDIDEAQGFLDLALRLRSAAPNRLRRDCDDLVASAKSIIHQLQHPKPAPGLKFCTSCGAPFSSERDAYCRTCGAGRRDRMVPCCGSCGAELGQSDQHCGVCGAYTAPTALGAATGTPGRVLRPAAVSRATSQGGDLGAPGIGVAGFVLSLLGVTVIGIILSWVGLAQARREGRPAGLCIAGIVIGFIWVGIIVVVFAISASLTHSLSSYQGY